MEISVKWLYLFTLSLFVPDIASLHGQALPQAKLIVDDGRYQQSGFVRQIAVTTDDRYVLVSDSKSGVRTYDMANGALINSLEGHALEGDSYYDPRHELLVTSGDVKLKIWDIRQQKLLKTIRQPFHSQFMTGIYLDSKKQLVFAQHVKYDLRQGRALQYYDLASWTGHFDLEHITPAQMAVAPTVETYFFRDKVYLFNQKSGQVKVYDCFTDAPAGGYSLSDFQPGLNTYFDGQNGRLFISYANRVRIVEIAGGASSYAFFDRSAAYSNVDRNSCYGVSADGNYLIAGSNQGVGLVVLKKIDPSKAFTNNTREVLRQSNVVVGEIAPLHNSNRVVYSSETGIYLLDLDTLGLAWQTGLKILSIRNISIAPDGRQLYLALGSQDRVNRHWFERTFAYNYSTYFESIDQNWGKWKPRECFGDLPAELQSMWDDRARTARLRLDQGTSFQPAPDELPFPPKGTHSGTTNPVKGRVWSPSRRYSIEVKDFGASVVYDGQRSIGRVPDLEVIYHVEYSPDERYVALGGSGRWVALVDLQTGRMVQKVFGESYITTITFSYDDEYFFTGSLKNEIMMWRLKDGKLVRRFTGSNGSIHDTEITPDNKTLLSAGDDGALRFWEVATGKLMLAAYVVNDRRHGPNKPPSSTVPASCGPQQTAAAGGSARDQAKPRAAPQSLSNLKDDNWVVVTPDGRFDTNNLDESKGLHWIMPDAPLRALPLEIFMRDYYEPRLVSRVLKGSPLRPVRALQAINRELPMVKIVRVETSKDRLGQSEKDFPPLATVTVQVETVQSTAQKDAKGNFLQSGVYDLRLFRNGQLVAQWPDVNPEADANLGAIDSGEKRDAWRKLHEIHLAGGKATVTLSNIRLPARIPGAKAGFTAYAFNTDRVKSLTTPSYDYALPVQVRAKPVSRRAYLITMGVNANQSHWNLEVAVSSAERARGLLRRKLAQEFPEIVEVPLYSELAAESARVASSRARKAYFQAVLDLLAGRPVDLQLRQEIDPHSQLRAATPDDAVVVYVASHGFADPGGSFYVIPYDTGPGWGLTEDVLAACSTQEDVSALCRQAKTFLSRSISSANLAAWWRGVDAGEAVMILDTCHAGAATGKEFRPGPLGDPGLGQLSYDKAMRILAASQPAQTEQGTWFEGGEGRTLLVEALETVARANPEWTLAEWLKGTERELPLRMKQLFPLVKDDDVQVPVLLDFGGRRETAAAGTLQ